MKLIGPFAGRCLGAHVAIGHVWQRGPVQWREDERHRREGRAIRAHGVRVHLVREHPIGRHAHSRWGVEPTDHFATCLHNFGIINIILSIC